jgi:hypothetical protein
MTRNPTDYVEVKIRMRVAMRRKLEREAEKKKISANAEALERIEKTFSDEGWFEARHKELEIERDKIVKRAEELGKELGLKGAAQMAAQAAQRDSTILNMMIENRRGSAYLLRTLARELGANPEWATTPESKKDFADHLHQYIMNNDFAKEPSE